MISTNPAKRPRLSPKIKKRPAKPMIWLSGQPPAESVGEMLGNIHDGSISQFMLILSDGVLWRLRATTDLGGNLRIDNIPTPWRVTIRRGKLAPVAMVVCTYAELQSVLVAMLRLVASLTGESQPGEVYRETDAAKALMAEMAGRIGGAE